MKRKTGTALVVGAGISGIRSALDLAETGYGVTLIDRSPNLGGVLSQLDHQFPSDGCGMCKMLPMIDRDASSQYCLRKGLFHENIDILLSTELVSVEGDPGNFQVTLRQKPNLIDPDRCTGCGACADACPIEVADDFNQGLTKRKAVYLPVPHAIPNPYVIDAGACNRCGECVGVCPTDAIRLPEAERKAFRVLVVDDELIVRDSLRAWLEDEVGFTVDMAESGPDALEKLSSRSYQLMLLDIKMPGMDGIEVLSKAKEAAEDLNVVMMTAYATVETAVEAMKIGALDYLIKPFDPEVLIPKVISIYEDLEIAKGRQMTVGAVVLSGGTSYYDPATGKNLFGYRQLPNVVTSLEFERIFSGTGPCSGRLVRPSDGKPVEKVAWLQCVGSRDLQSNADFCSNICCMYAIKEARLAKEKSNGSVETAIFYMDMRTFGKAYQRYRDEAEQEYGVRFERARIHSVIPDISERDSERDLILRYASTSGEVTEEGFDMVVLAVGQRPAPGSEKLAEQLGIALNPWGFCQAEGFSLTRSSREGVFLGGTLSGLKDIGDSVTQASAAALAASRVIHESGGGLAVEPDSEEPPPVADREIARILVAVCTCGGRLDRRIDIEKLTARLKQDPHIDHVVFPEATCTADGWASIAESMDAYKPNRVLIGTCLPYVYNHKLKELGRQWGLASQLTDVVDIGIRDPYIPEGNGDDFPREVSDSVESILLSGIARLKHANPLSSSSLQVCQKALVVGGGIAGLTSALAIADHGFEVTVVEKEDRLGGNLNWMGTVLGGNGTEELLTETISKAEKHPNVEILKNASVVSAYGQVGQFSTTVEEGDGSVRLLDHGVVILATGGGEANTTAYLHGGDDAVITQKELEIGLNNKTIEPDSLTSVVMIQCVDSRIEPRNYCSRVCCISALKHALKLKEENPDIDVYILYRDIMTYGFSEAYFTKARNAGIVFLQYDLDNRPEIEAAGAPEVTDGRGPALTVRAVDPILGQTVEIRADLVALSTGITPNLPVSLAEAFGAAIDRDGFFQEAETKWRPVDSLKEGVFACGLAQSPRTLSESIAAAEAAAQRALRILSREEIPAGKVVATVHHSICSLCERCIDECPYGARFLNSEEGMVQVNPAMCQGCGACAAICPNGASMVEGFAENQMFEIIDAALDGTYN